jgi:hypothetical protein
MKIENHNIYMHYVFTTFKRLPVILEKNRKRIEKYTGCVREEATNLINLIHIQHAAPPLNNLPLFLSKTRHCTNLTIIIS